MAVNVGSLFLSLFPLALFLRAGIKVPGAVLRVYVGRYHYLSISFIPTTWHSSARATAGLRIDTVSTLGADILEGRWTLKKEMHNVMLSRARCAVKEIDRGQA